MLHWLRRAERECSLQRTWERGFEMNGRAPCILTKDDFRLRAPGSGLETHWLSLTLEALVGPGIGRKIMLTPSMGPPLFP